MIAKYFLSLPFSPPKWLLFGAEVFTHFLIFISVKLEN